MKSYKQPKKNYGAQDTSFKTYTDTDNPIRWHLLSAAGKVLKVLTWMVYPLDYYYTDKSKLTAQEEKELRAQYKKMPLARLQLERESLKKQRVATKTYQRYFGGTPVVRGMRMLALMGFFIAPLDHCLRGAEKQEYIKENITRVENGAEQAKADIPSKYSDNWFLFDQIAFATSLATLLFFKARDVTYKKSKTYAQDLKVCDKYLIANAVFKNRVYERERA